ncbi:MAG: HAD hydrolase family protein [Thermoflexaceae bacterium]|nr:HAD hydrolase family protein [Thermoflexaceae bacterium]
MEKILSKKFPKIGLRIIKSSVAVALCYLVSFLRGNSGIVFYSQLAALWCMQVYVENTRKNAIQRTIGTVIGALYGLVFLLMKNQVRILGKTGAIVDAAAISLMLIAVLYTTVLIKKKQASYFSCVVFLSIVVNHMTDANPYLFVWNRFLDTMIGIAIGIGVNCFSLPKEKHKDILFISGLDDTLLNSKESLSDYSRVELNRMLDEGVNFTISTMRTPASLMEPMHDIRLKLPVIAMDGAVLYDIREKMYLKTYVMSSAESKEVLSLIKEQGLMCFTNVIVDDMLVIYYDEPVDEVQKQLVARMRKSPYRNYVRRPLPETEYVVYFMMLYPDDVINDFYHVLKERGFAEKLKILYYPSTDYPGYSYIKIYNKNATKENMTAYLKEMLHLEKTVTFGSIPGRYDYVVDSGDSNQVVHVLKKLYETVKVPKAYKKQ